MSFRHDTFAGFISGRFWKRRKAVSGKTADRIAIAGTTLAILTVLLTFSVLMGFKQELRQKLLSVNPIVTIDPAFADNDDFDHDDMGALVELINEKYQGRAFLSEISSFPALIKSETNFDNIIVSHKSFSGFDVAIPAWVSEINDPDGLFLSESTARKLNVDTGDVVDIALIDNHHLKIRRFPIAGTYSTNIAEFDDRMAFISATALSWLRSSIPGLTSRQMAIEGTDFTNEEIAALVDDIKELFYIEHFNGNIKGSYYMTSILDTATGYFAWLSLIDTNVWVITILMILIAAFTLIGALVIKILECVSMVGLLKALGASNRQIKPIFIHGGMALVLKSIVVSNVLALTLILLQQHFAFLPLDPSEYYLDKVPMVLYPLSFLCIDLGTLIVGFGSLLLPTLIINKVAPSEVVKFK